MRCSRSVWQGLAFTVLVVIALRQFLEGSWRSGNLVQKRNPLETSDTSLCFVIRTYWGHGTSHGSPLLKILNTLVENTHPKWEALILVMDRKPFDELHDMIDRLADKRIRIYAEKVGDNHNARLADGSWNPQYHDDLYNLTDEAIRACSPDTQWVIITNGDNEYDKRFIPRILQAPDDADIIAFDFYSRYQRVTATPCERFAAEAGAPPCKENLLRFCNTDLAATVYRWPRFMNEDRAFSKVPSNGIGLNDGLLARLLKSSGWKVDRVSDMCLLSHSPSPQLCALHGGVWDDSVFLMPEHTGGRCLDDKEAAEYLQQFGGSLEVVEIMVSHDDISFGFEAGKPLPLACIRSKLTTPWVNKWYPPQCAAIFDGGEDY